MSKMTKEQLLEIKTKEIKGVIRCMSGRLAGRGVFGGCSGCADDYFCLQLRKVVKERIRKVCAVAERMQEIRRSVKEKP